MASYLITGASRGLGFEMVKALLQKPANEVSTVFAAIRSAPPPALQEVIAQSQGRVVVVKLEVSDEASIAAAANDVKDKLAGRGLDVLINNAAIASMTPTPLTAATTLQNAFKVNVDAVHRITVAFLPLLREGTKKTVLNVSSIVGSITHTKRFMISPDHGYRVSKAALNCLMSIFACELEDEGFTFVAVSPGWCRTDQGGPYADLDAQTGGVAVIEVLDRDRSELNGKFVNIKVAGWENAAGLHQYNGAEIPW
ncbi:hypothetical protein VC83_08093 [Pseudogymnoascus destructans]|uniref:Short chain oxidoreductase n=2 Tax=Pseudogymnoascus destructans TaxID=655981 RepID=L8FTK1_PSED2|nr:uncharacterized protein VC83_08093 [Pseudogymnoascus destructans]ELR04285.1 hypothetical protein GMDG_06681 [Pseudogymnoascus destructans 20631-21]OAF55883.1 hypothetical protein VC83_08093 [Pseudogymnoascus destructans]